MGIVKTDDFEKYAPGAAVTTTSGFFDAVDAAATVQVASLASQAPAQRRYLNYKRTVSANGFTNIPVTPAGNLILARFYLTLITAPSANSAIIYWIGATANRAQMFLSTTRTIQLRNVTAAVGVASSALTLGKRYLCNYYADTTGTQRLWIRNPDRSLFYDSTALAMTAASIDHLRIGNPTAATLEYNVGNLQIATSQNVELDDDGPYNESFMLAA